MIFFIPATVQYAADKLSPNIDSPVSRQVTKERHVTYTPMISIIDDDESIRVATESLIRSLGFIAFTFELAEDFLKSPQVDATSCLISDIQMPGMTGIELQAHLIANGYRIPTIFITAFPEERIRERAEQAGADRLFEQAIRRSGHDQMSRQGIEPELTAAV